MEDIIWITVLLSAGIAVGVLTVRFLARSRGEDAFYDMLRIEDGHLIAFYHGLCGTAEESYAFDEEVRRTDDESGLSVVDDKMDISPLIRDTLLAAQPICNVCRPDCLGLCPKCGANLNEGECGCDRAAPDPRLAVLEQLLKKQEI